MPLINVADLGCRYFRKPLPGETTAQRGDVSDFGTLLNFTVWMLFYVDGERDGPALPKVSRSAVCEPLPRPKFRERIDDYQSNARRPLPDFLHIGIAGDCFVQVFPSFIDEQITVWYPIRSTLVGRDGGSFIALQSCLNI
jgi:hypothetical protein